jgi:5-methyltetrahydropteroyltriglutamate--homocysteine methyltransferase
MDVLVDDAGSFPLPESVSRDVFGRAYVLAREAMASGKDIRKDEFLADNFCRVIVDSFRRKCAAGLDVVNYPQHYDMHLQFLEPIRSAMSEGTYVVGRDRAFVPEVRVIEGVAKELSEEFGRRLSLRVCVTGPLELYLREVGVSGYEDVLLMFAESVRRFAESSILDSKYVRTEVVSLDEPSFGFRDVSVGRDLVVGVLERAFDFRGVVRQVHLHSPVRVSDVLGVKGVDVVTFEFAGSPGNIEGLSRGMFERVDKWVRVGVSRTDVDAIRAELYDRGVTGPGVEDLVESEEVIRKRFMIAFERFGDRMAFAGPDCGLGGWPSQEAAEVLLRRTVRTVKSVSK